MVEIINFIKLFVFIFCCMNILKNTYNFIKVMRMEEGQFNNGKYGNLCFGLSLSYILTMLITGF